MWMKNEASTESQNFFDMQHEACIDFLMSDFLYSSFHALSLSHTHAVSCALYVHFSQYLLHSEKLWSESPKQNHWWGEGGVGGKVIDNLSFVY